MEEARNAIENILEEHIRYNTNNDILPSETTVCRRLLMRNTELIEAYDELWAKTNYSEFYLRVFIDGLLGTAAFWNPSKMAEARRMRAKLEDVNQKISGAAMELAELLRERTKLHDHSGFVSETHYHVLEVLGEAARNNPRFASFVQEPLEALRGQFDLKYWPSLSDFVSVLEVDAARATVNAHHSLTAAGTASSRPSRADFFRALFKFIEENRDDGHLPTGLKLTDATYASLANCALDLGPDDLAGAEYVKRLRQRDREEDR
ncbi:hypothetical protein JUM41_25185 [Rhizobium pusense]|uniref:hypothetical protein n=1 Tax=Agrobacterium pusense TaxID=648995 RepID=UPI001FCD7280|nr:hypothetical protein [Agrobacterium pusense]MCJ2877541.1 hypothetical protein [Agrobacterium pusense]